MSTALVTALVASILGLIGTIAAVLIAGALKSREAKRTAEETKRTAEETKRAAMIARAASFNLEWHGDVISKARVLAHALLRKEWSVMLRHIEQKHPDDFNWIWRLMEFFAKLHAEIELGTVQKDDVRRLFGEQIVWWWIVGFSTRADFGEMCSYDGTQELYNWLEGFCRGSRYEAKYERWVKGAQTTRARYSASGALAGSFV